MHAGSQAQGFLTSLSQREGIRVWCVWLNCEIPLNVRTVIAIADAE